MNVKGEREEERPASGDSSSREERGGGQKSRKRQRKRQEWVRPTFQWECSKREQKVLLVTAVGDVSCQDLKGRAVQTPGY